MIWTSGVPILHLILALTMRIDEDNRENICHHGLIPVIKPNPRGTKDREKIYARLDKFNEKIYKERHKIERSFAWGDVYRKLVIRYEKLQ